MVQYGSHPHRIPRTFTTGARLDSCPTYGTSRAAACNVIPTHAAHRFTTPTFGWTCIRTYSMPPFNLFHSTLGNTRTRYWANTGKHTALPRLFTPYYLLPHKHTRHTHHACYQPWHGHCFCAHVLSAAHSAAMPLLLRTPVVPCAPARTGQPLFAILPAFGRLRVPRLAGTRAHRHLARGCVHRTAAGLFFSRFHLSASILFLFYQFGPQLHTILSICGPICSPTTTAYPPPLVVGFF